MANQALEPRWKVVQTIRSIPTDRSAKPHNQIFLCVSCGADTITVYLPLKNGSVHTVHMCKCGSGESLANVHRAVGAKHPLTYYEKFL